MLNTYSQIIPSSRDCCRKGQKDERQGSGRGHTYAYIHKVIGKCCVSLSQLFMLQVEGKKGVPGRIQKLGQDWYRRSWRKRKESKQGKWGKGNKIVRPWMKRVSQNLWLGVENTKQMGDSVHREQRTAGKICEMLWLLYSQAEASHSLAPQRLQQAHVRAWMTPTKAAELLISLAYAPFQLHCLSQPWAGCPRRAGQGGQLPGSGPAQITRVSPGSHPALVPAPAWAAAWPTPIPMLASCFCKEASWSGKASKAAAKVCQYMQFPKLQQQTNRFNYQDRHWPNSRGLVHPLQDAGAAAWSHLHEEITLCKSLIHGWRLYRRGETALYRDSGCMADRQFKVNHTVQLYKTYNPGRKCVASKS